MDNLFKSNILWQNKTHNNQIYDSVLFKEFEIIFHGKKTTGFEYESLAIFQKFVPGGIIKKTVRNRIVSKLSVSYQIINS